MECKGFYPYFNPFSNTPALNILEGFDGSEPVEDDGTGLNVTYRPKELVVIFLLIATLFCFLVYVYRFFSWAVMTSEVLSSLL